MALGVALFASASGFAAERGPVMVHACARLADLTPPLEAASRLRELSPGERRARLITILRADAVGKSREIRHRLRSSDAEQLRLIWSAGVVCAEAPRTVWTQIATLDSVSAVFEDPPRLAEEIDDADASGPNENVAPEPPLISMRVPEAWERGFTGRGVVVALIDTGVDMTHPDLADQIWTNEDEIPDNGIDDDGNGYIDDTRGWDFASQDNDPSDSAGHGTNAAGLLVGDGSSGTQTGVAPDLIMMVLRRGTTEAALWEASQYAIENGAQILSQSTSWKWSFDPPPDYASWRRQAESELAAGMIHTNSGGNTGQQLDTDPVPYNIAAPANCPPPWLSPDMPQFGGVSSVLGIGNIDADSLMIAPRSPMGPAEWTDIAANVDATYPYVMPADLQDYPHFDGSGGLGKPDLTAPGDGSLTTELGGGYDLFSGTSAATPRVAGILALLLQAVPSATPAELTEAILTSARDLGPLGRDDRFGAGMPDADAALDALGPPIRLVGYTVIDSGGAQGDGDANADEGEINRLELTLENTSPGDLDNVELILRAVDGVAVRDGFQNLALLPALGQATSAPPHFGIEFLAGSCSQTAELDLEIRQGESRRVERIFLGVGTEARTALLDADFESDAGFSVGGAASSGAWIRANPVGTIKDGRPANPDTDAGADPAVLAWVTGNGPTSPDAADVDGGETVLTSPARDALGFDSVELSYSRWFFSDDPTAMDQLVVEATGDGTTYSIIEEVTARDNSWRNRRVVLSDLIVPGANTRLRWRASDNGADHTIEAGLDDVFLEGVSLACTPWTVTQAQPADPVGDSLRLRRSAGNHLLLTWAPPSAAGGTDPEKGYGVTTSPDASLAFEEIARPTLEEWTEVDAFLDPAPITYYLVDSLP